MSEQDPRVPPEVEEFFAQVFAAAGQLGGSIGGAIGGGAAGSRGAARGGARGGARAARRMTTTVEDRGGQRPGDPAQLRERLTRHFTRAQTMSDRGGVWRVDLPLGRAGLGHAVADLTFVPHADADEPLTDVTLRVYCKQGLLRRRLTANTADEVWAALGG